MGTYCRRSKIYIKTWTELFGAQRSDRWVIQERVTEEECKALSISKNCFGGKMSCSGDKCSFEKEPDIKRNYWIAIENTIYNCEIGDYLVLGNTLTQPLFSDALSSCLAKDMHCILPRTTVIWEQNIIHNCPYSRIQSLNATLTDNIVVGDNFMFQISNTFNECNMEISETTEGVYLTESKSAASLEASSLEMNENFHLILAVEDY